MKKWLWPLALLLAGTAPAEAAPRVTLQLERASLHEVLMQLNQMTGFRLTGPGGAGRSNYKDPPNARRTRVDFRDIPIGKALREVAAAHDLIPQAAGGYVGFVPRGGVAGPKEGLAGPGSKIALSFHRLSQSEYRELVPGTGPASEERTLDLRLCLRSLEGDGDVFGAVRRLKLTDDQGRVREVPAEWYSQELGRGLPDERFLDLSVPWKGPHPPRLRKVEGTVEVFSGVAERKVVLTIPSGGVSAMPPTGVEGTSGPFRVKLLRLTTQAAVSARVRIEWATAGQNVVFNDEGMVRAALLLPDGQSVAMAGQARRGKADPAFVVGDFYAPAVGQPVSVEVMVPTRSSVVREEPLAIHDLTLPFGLPHALRTQPLHEPTRPLNPIRYRPPSPLPPVLQQPGGGVLRVALPRAPAGFRDEWSLGLQRQVAGGAWGSLHWVPLESEGAALTLEDLAEGTYRFTLRRLQRTIAGAPAGPPAVWKSPPLAIRKGRTANLTLPASLLGK